MAQPRNKEAERFSIALDEEIAQIRLARGKPRGDEPATSEASEAYRRSHEEQLVGLAFSGGGIRSATFNLGVLQCLNVRGLLQRFDYLSTVSGGGYIGGWLAAWIKRKNGLEQVLDESRRYRKQTRQEPHQVGFLREYSNYLTPRKGLFGVDTWTVAGTYLRNTSLNLLILVLALTALLMTPHVVARAYRSWGNSDDVVAWHILVIVLLMGFALAWVVKDLSGTMKREMRERGSGDYRTWVTQACVVLPILVAAWLLSHWIWSHDLPREWPYWVFGAGLAYFVLWLMGWLVGGLGGGRRKPIPAAPEAGASKAKGWERMYKPLTDFRDELTRRTGIRAVPVLATSVLSGMLLGLLLWLSLNWFRGWPVEYATAYGAAWIIAVLLISAILHEGLAGSGFSEESREWWSRLGASLARWTVAFTALFALWLHTNDLADWIRNSLEGWSVWLLSSGWLATTISGVLASRSRPGGRGKNLVVSVVTAVAPFVFVVGLLFLLSRLSHEIAAGLPSSGRLLEDLAWLLLVAGILVLAALLLSWRVGINEFSMHALYRNRLCRCYLGASNERRDEHPFTGFAPDDDFPLSDLWIKDRGGRPKHVVRPYPIFNTTLNLVGGERLAWQKRKAASFAFTPRFCGFEFATLPKSTAGRSKGRLVSAFRPTRRYGGGPSLATVMAISGAAASPNMGYHSSPALTFLMTVFNVRLGWWMANPQRDSWRKASPWAGLYYLVTELLGLTNTRRSFVYLSDGGHFDNLGIYELVRRRCRFIVAYDAEQDREMKFGALGNVIEKCRTDFGININIDVDPIRQVDERGHQRWHCAVGEIRYDKVDHGAPRGTLIYIKSSLTGDEPSDVLKYAANHPGFPHESTADQWFDESQFESYRALGYHVTDDVFSRVPELEVDERGELLSPVEPTQDTETLFVQLADQWHAPSRISPQSFHKHAIELDRIYQTQRRTPELRFLDAQIYPEWKELMASRDPGFTPEYGLPEEPEPVRAGFYFCNRLIELMESVYRDLDLEQERAHPDNRGWMNLFRHWSWSSMMRVTWAVCAGNYGVRFQDFCDRYLGMRLGTILVSRVELGRPENADELVEAGSRAFNFQEIKYLSAFARRRGASPEDFEAYSLELLTEHPLEPGRDAALLRFHFGFALVEKDGLLFFRVQDHLRGLGLGRKALKQLIRRFREEDRKLEPTLEKFPADAPRIPSESAMLRFRELFRSVEYELD